MNHPFVVLERESMKKQIFEKEWLASIRAASVSQYSSIVIRSPYKLQQHWV